MNDNITFASNKAKVSNTAAFTLALNLSPNILIKGPVMWTTDGCKAAADVNLITSPNIKAAASFSSGKPFKIDSLNSGRIGVMP